jgi:hypothetical protein
MLLPRFLWVKQCVKRGFLLVFCDICSKTVLLAKWVIWAMSRNVPGHVLVPHRIPSFTHVDGILGPYGIHDIVGVPNALKIHCSGIPRSIWQAWQLAFK